MLYRLTVYVGAVQTILALVEGSTPEIVAHQRRPTDTIFDGRRSHGQALADALRDFLRENRVELSETMGVGVGVPGIVSRDGEQVISCPNLHELDGTWLGPDTASELGIPVFVSNNTNLIALGEHSAGIGQGVDDMAVVFVSSGVGSGLILNGSLYQGTDGAAAEIGHTIVVQNGRLCSCGARGCLEMYCSAKALSLVGEELFEPEELSSLNTRFAGARLVIERALAGHSKARQALSESFSYLGIALVNLVNLLNPQLIVLGGDIVFAWPEGVGIAQEVVKRETRPQARPNIRIEVSQLKNYAGVMGGAALVTERLAHSH
ncbi:MAG: hypothetical protein A2Y73_01080 [Chloroflexi bacterium RBG_13_56_8]|nr:MAG: hypothetical protein A2Y73_01080 [Chloroflexi bacterium RBG_13_56_8]